MATLTTRFNLGQRVFRIVADTETIKLPCRTCRGSGWLTAAAVGGTTRQVKCPDCFAKPGLPAVAVMGTWPQWRAEPEPLQIGQITMRVYDHDGPDNGESAENLNLARVHLVDEERYMAWSTGVGSGSLYRVEDLFASLEDAEAEAEDRTARARDGEPVGDWRKWWPTEEQVRVASGFLDHRDVYEHDAGHIALAEAIIATAAAREAREAS